MELDTATWRRVLDEAAEFSMLQVSCSDGEPTLRRRYAPAASPARHTSDSEVHGPMARPTLTVEATGNTAARRRLAP